MNIILVGLRGSGKSTVGEQMARVLRRNFLDLDGLIEKNFKGTIVRIFEEEGEEGFRKRERAALESCIEIRSTVLAVGGGAILSSRNREIMKKLGTIVYLQVSLEQACNRIEHDIRRGIRRPALTRLSLKKEMEALLDRREALYLSLADFAVDTSGLSVDEVAEEVGKILGL